MGKNIREKVLKPADVTGSLFNIKSRFGPRLTKASGVKDPQLLIYIYMYLYALLFCVCVCINMSAHPYMHIIYIHNHKNIYAIVLQLALFYSEIC